MIMRSLIKSFSSEGWGGGEVAACRTIHALSVGWRDGREEILRQ